MTKFLVTGSTGLIGKQVVKDLVEENFTVYTGYNKNKSDLGVPTCLDLRKKEKIIEIYNKIEPEIIIHLGAMTDVDKCETQKDEANIVNTVATEILAKESSKNNAFFIFVSTDYVFDGKNGLKNENDTPNPLNFYGKSKLNAENAVKKFASRYAIIRTSTPFGIHPKKKSFPLWVKENLESKKEISVLTDQFTSPTFVPDLSKMIIEIAKKQITGIIHLAGPRISRYEFAKIIAEKFNLDKIFLKPIEIHHMKWKAIRPRDSSLDISKAEKILENKPKSIEQSLDVLLKQIQNLSS